MPTTSATIQTSKRSHSASRRHCAARRSAQASRPALRHQAQERAPSCWGMLVVTGHVGRGASFAGSSGRTGVVCTTGKEQPLEDLTASGGGSAMAGASSVEEEAMAAWFVVECLLHD